MRQVMPDSLELYVEIVGRGTVCEGARLELEIVPARLRCCGAEWEPPSFRCPTCGGGGEVVAGNEFLVESIEIEEAAMHRTHVKVLEDVLDANGTIAAANRDDFDRAGVTAVNLMQRPGAGKTTLLERSLRKLDGVRVGVLEGDVASTLDGDRIAHLHLPVVQIDTDPSFGGECHLDANMVRSALPSLPLDEARPAVIENVGNLVCPAEFRGRRAPPRDGLVGRRGRGQAAQVSADVPRLRARDHEQDRPTASPRFRPRQVSASPRRGPSRTSTALLVSARTGEGIDAWRDVARTGGNAGRPSPA